VIYLLTGDNAYQVRQHTAKLLQSAHGAPKRLDGDSISLNTLPDLMMGMSLFGAPEPLVIRGLSENESVWQKFVEWIPRVNDEQLIILIEPKLDKRTKAYKTLVGQVEVIETKQWSDRDQRLAAEWLRTRAKELKISLSPSHVEDMVRRAHVPSEKPGTFLIDQMRLHSALQALGGDTEVADDMIDAVMPKAMGDTIFDLLSIAAEGNKPHVRTVLDELRAREDAHKVFAILASQWVQLVSVAISEGVTADLGIHPYVVQKLSVTARQFSRGELRTLTRLAALIDTGMKRSQFEPWDGVERFVIGIATRRQLLA
jgi:DNA polymerase III delta subunit